MRCGVVRGCDEQVAKWAWRNNNLTPLPCTKALGVVAPDGQLVGAALFHNYSGCDVELSYFGRNTVTLGIVKLLAREAIAMGVARVSIRTSKSNKRILRWLPKIGARLEGVSRRFYGNEDCSRSTAVRFVLFQEDLARLARSSKDKTDAGSTTPRL
jgi:RimJ/RimL family protein N-acetyltransferase